jgi:tetraacyldisaccharide 4'-kinase
MKARRRGDTHRLLRWLWTSRRLDARLARAALLPAAGLWRAGAAARQAAYRRGWLAPESLPLPTVLVTNLTVGGSGRGAVAAWAARHLAARGSRPALLLRGDPADVGAARHGGPGVIVVGDPVLARAAAEAVARGAEILVVADPPGGGDLMGDFTIAVLSAETSRAVRWPVPAGPWREGMDALARADAVVITRRRAPPDVAETLARELGDGISGPIAVADLNVREVEGLVSGRRQPVTVLLGKRVVAASTLADPDAFATQLKAAGAQVQVHTWADRHDFRDEDVAWLAHASRRADHVVLGPRDAAQLRDRWPAAVPEPFVVVAEPTWDSGGDALAAALDAALLTSSTPDSPENL